MIVCKKTRVSQKWKKDIPKKENAILLYLEVPFK